MATRALIGYIENGVLTSTYNHYDGYPSNLGKALENFFDSPSLAKDIANYGYISYIDPETGEIEAANSQAPKKLDLNKLDSEQAAEEVAVLVDSFGADYAYFYNPTSMEWEHVQNNGIRSMMGPLESILFQGSEEMDEAYHVGGNKEVITKESPEINEDLIAKAEMALKGKANLDDYLKSLKNDIRLNGEEGYADYTTDEDWEEDYSNYTSVDEAFAHQMKYKAGLIK